jgi:hypothetical protein
MGLFICMSPSFENMSHLVNGLMTSLLLTNMAQIPNTYLNRLKSIQRDEIIYIHIHTHIHTHTYI